MKRILHILFPILAIFVALPSYAGIDKMYIQRSSGGSNIFFIDVQKMPGIDGTKGSMKYDYTYAQPTDSVALLMTVIFDSAAHKLFCSAKYDGGEYKDKCEIIYVKPKGNKFEYRLRIYMPFETFEKFYSSVTPLVISINGDNDASMASFGYKPEKWQKNRKDINAIIQIIRINTGKTD